MMAVGSAAAMSWVIEASWQRFFSRLAEHMELLKAYGTQSNKWAKLINRPPKSAQAYR